MMSTVVVMTIWLTWLKKDVQKKEEKRKRKNENGRGNASDIDKNHKRKKVAKKEYVTSYIFGLPYFDGC